MKKPPKPPPKLPPTKEQRLAIFVENAQHRVSYEYAQRSKPAKKIVSDAASLCEYIMCPASILCEAALDLIGSPCFDEESKLAVCLRVVDLDTDCNTFVLTDFGKQLLNSIAANEQKDIPMKKPLKAKRESAADRQARYDEDHRIIAESAKRAGEESLKSLKRLTKPLKSKAATVMAKADYEAREPDDSPRPRPQKSASKKTPPVEHGWLVQVRDYLTNHLSLSMSQSGFTDPNARTVNLVLDGETISSVSFSVVQTREYEG